jgi:menaquinone-dependent protoporphyrinogen oxidase
MFRSIMGTVPVFYATTEGQTRRIAEQIASTLRQQGFVSEAREISTAMPPVDWLKVAGVVLGASIYAGRHQKTAVEFARNEARHLSARPSAFFSVSLSAGSRNPAEVDAARALARDFVTTAHWNPRRLACFAGKLAYSRYGFFKRQMMRVIAWREAAPTDTRRDYEFTDWTAVRRFALDIAEDVSRDRSLAEVRPGEVSAPA